MLRDQFRSWHAIVVNHDHLVAAGVDQPRREREDKNRESDPKKSHRLVI
jgi:hypothetical protein